MTSDGDNNKGSSFNDVKLYVTQLRLGQVVKSIKEEEEKMVQIEEELVRAKEMQNAQQLSITSWKWNKSN